MAIDASVRQIRVGNDVFVRLSENCATKEAIFAENGEIRFESIAGSKPTYKLKLVPGELGPAREVPANIASFVAPFSLSRTKTSFHTLICRTEASMGAVGAVIDELRSVPSSARMAGHKTIHSLRVLPRMRNPKALPPIRK